MRVLAVDTSSERGSACVMERGDVLAEVRLACSVQHSERLFRSIDFLFNYVPFALADIDLFAAARGPGSFTGLRLGLAAMEGFASAHNKPGAGVSTLEALAWKSGVEDCWIAPTIDARRGEVYGAVYERRGGELAEIVPPVVLPPDQWFSDLPDRPLAICGDGALRYRDLITQVKQGPWRLVEMDLFLANAVGRRAPSQNRGPLAPLYVRRPVVEEARERAL
jgi:tRNA threonylcarbamoyladenosine biosynthesis protein TsaB